MPVNVIGTLKPKNNGKFPVAEAVDIKVTDDLRLDKALENKADLSTVNFALSGKADNEDINDLQSQIDLIITPVTQDSEVQNARVDVEGVTHSTLKDRLDSETEKALFSISELNGITGVTWHNNGYIGTDGDIHTGDIHRYYSDFIICRSGDITYTAETDHNNVLGISFYDSNLTLISGESNVAESGTEVTSTVPNGAAFCRISSKDTILSISGIKFSESQLAKSLQNIYSSIPNVTPIEETIDVISSATQNLWKYGDQAFTKLKIFDLDTPIPSGTITFSAIIDSEDTTDTTSRVEFRNPTEDKVYAIPVGRDTRASKTFTTDFSTTRIILYSGKTDSSSTGKDVIYTDIQVETGNETEYVPPLSAADYIARTNKYNAIKFVSTTGNDSNDGNSNSTPYKTISKAISMNPKCIFVEYGVYTEKINCQNTDVNICADNITINAGAGDAINMENCNISLKGITVTNASGQYGSGFRLKNCVGTLSDCKSINSGYMGFRITGSKLTFERCIANNSGVDGFNGHDYTDDNSVVHHSECTFIDCIADNNGDDGCSFHEDGSFKIIGGEYSNNVSTGFAPHQHCTASIKNAYIHGNNYGIECLNPDEDTTTQVESFCNLIKDNITAGIHADYYNVISVGDKFNGNAENTIAGDNGTITIY